VQLFCATAVKAYREQKATSFLMGQLSVAYGGTTEKLAQFFRPPRPTLTLHPLLTNFSNLLSIFAVSVA
jgi:hypothetical protein